MGQLEVQLEKTAAELVMVEADDLPALAALHDLLLELKNQISGPFNQLVATVQKGADLVEFIVRGDVPDPERQLGILREAIACLQMIVNGKPAEEVVFPPSLAPSDVTPQPADSTPTDEAAPESPEGVGAEVDGEFLLDTSGADASLLADFVTEAREHCSTAEQLMMELETGADQDAAINGIFRAFHTIKGAAGFLALGPLGTMAHESETLLDKIRKGTLQIDSNTGDVVFNAIDALRQLLKCVEDGMASGEPIDTRQIVQDVLAQVRAAVQGEQPVAQAEPGRVGDILIQMGAVDQKQIDAALAGKSSPEKRLGETLVDQGLVKAKTVAHALKVQSQVRQEPERAKQGTVREMVRIDTERLDRLMDTIGELVIAESMVSQDETLLAKASPRVVKNVTHLSKITRELQEMSMTFRLVPIKATVQKLARAVRDLAKKSGKQVDFITVGEDTEVDRGIVENIGDPLMHMIRNSVDHGLESPQDRAEAGKPETGRLWLKAYQKSGSIFFEIEDDGRGLDSEAILAKARQRGMVGPQQELSEEDIHRLIMMPGFSTAKKVTDISGRGVGMDVVKKNLEKMRGQLDISSQHGGGTKFTIRLPLTLAIVDGMLVNIAGQRYIIPTMSVSESVNLADDMIHSIGGKYEMVSLRGRLLPLVYAAELFGQCKKADRGGNRIVVVIEDGGRTVGLVTDELLGKHQTVIKSLGPVFSNQKCVSGGSILSDGSVGLIVDVSAVVQTVNAPHNAAFGTSGATAESEGKDAGERLEEGALVGG